MSGPGISLAASMGKGNIQRRDYQVDGPSGAAVVPDTACRTATFRSHRQHSQPHQAPTSQMFSASMSSSSTSVPPTFRRLFQNQDHRSSPSPTSFSGSNATVLAAPSSKHQRPCQRHPRLQCGGVHGFTCQYFFNSSSAPPPPSSSFTAVPPFGKSLFTCLP